MSTLASKTRIAEDTSRRLGELVKSLKGWNLITGLYTERNSTQDDLIHAYGIEARDVVLLSLRLTFELGAAGLKGHTGRFNNLLRRLDGLDARERNLAKACRKVYQGERSDAIPFVIGKEGK